MAERETEIAWSQIIPPNKSTLLVSKDMNIVFITEAFVSDKELAISEQNCELTATIKTLIPDDEEKEENDEPSKYKEKSINVATLIPNVAAQLSLQFSPLDIVVFYNKGPLDIHLSGYLAPISDSDEDTEEESAQTNKIDPINITPDIIQDRLRALGDEQGPRPAKKNKKKSKEPELVFEE